MVFHFLMVLLLINLTQCKYGLDTLTRLVPYYLYSIQTETDLNVMSKVHVKFNVSTKILPLVTKKKKKKIKIVQQFYHYYFFTVVVCVLIVGYICMTQLLFLPAIEIKDKLFLGFD